MHLTSIETTALADLYESSRSNSHQFGYPDDMPNVPRPSRGGAIASLSKKGLIVVFDNQGDGIPNQFEFTPAGAFAAEAAVLLASCRRSAE